MKEKNGGSRQTRGIIDAIISSSSFGFSPFFSVSLLALGLGTMDVLSYRWGVAALALCIIAAAGKKSLKVTGREFGKIFLLSIFRALTSFTLLIGYANIASGVASTIHFTYPVIVAFCMMFIFGEKKSPVIIVAIILSVVGAYCLAEGDTAEVAGGDKTKGIIASAASVLCYAGYVILLRKTGADRIESTKLTIYVLGLSAVYFIIAGCIAGGIKIVTEPAGWLYILGISLVCTMVSNFFLVNAVKNAGPTLASVFGALEPLTAVLTGVLFLNERLSAVNVAGILLILGTVTIVVVHQKAQKNAYSRP